MKTAYRLAMLAPFALVAMLAACNDNSPEAANFAPEKPDNGAAAVAGGQAAPAELSQEERSQPLSAISDCNLERLDGNRFSGEPVHVAAPATIELSGWLADTATQSAPGSFELRLIGGDSNRAWKVDGHTGHPRTDVQALLGGGPGYANVGYSLTLSTASLPHESYRMYVVYRGQAGFMSCDNGRSIVVGE